jgi:hypothetical protein
MSALSTAEPSHHQRVQGRADCVTVGQPTDASSVATSIAGSAHAFWSESANAEAVSERTTALKSFRIGRLQRILSR